MRQSLLSFQRAAGCRRGPLRVQPDPFAPQARSSDELSSHWQFLRMACGTLSSARRRRPEIEGVASLQVVAAQALQVIVLGNFQHVQLALVH